MIALRGEQVLERETGRLASLHSFAGLIRWRDALVEVNALRSGAYGCALGSMASELADSDDRLVARGQVRLQNLEAEN